MDMNQLLQLGAKAFMKSPGSGEAGSNLDIGTLTSALSTLNGAEKGLDIQSLVGGMQSGGMADLLQSWLGDGQNQPISGNQISNLLGADNISNFASRLGLSKEEAMGGLQDAMPEMVDKASSGGALLEFVSGSKGIIGLARKFLGQ